MLGAPSGKRETGDEIKSCSRSSQITNSYRMLHFERFLFICLTYKNAQRFRMGQSTNSMARIMKANQLGKVCASTSHEYLYVEKNQESL